MKILFLTLVYQKSSNSIYRDLMNEIVRRGHEVYVATTSERRENRGTCIENDGQIKILRINTLNIQKTNIVEKGIATLTIEGRFIKEIKKKFSSEKFDLVIYSTPPITFEKVIRFLKDNHKAKSYLLLKDIFPQNAVDIGMFSKKSLIYKFFRKKEERLYSVSDYIGCMSPKNVEYLTSNNNVNIKNIEVCPNSINPSKGLVINSEIRERYKVNNEDLLVIYGGNLGKPQGIDFLIDILKSNDGNNNVKFLVVGSGTEEKKIDVFLKENNIKNVIFKNKIPKEQYDDLVRASDLGLILLDQRFTIPNFPSRLLGYMDASIPILAATDSNTDIGEIIEKNNFGYWCESGDLESFNAILHLCSKDKKLLKEKGLNGRKYLENNYTAKHSADIILSHFN